MAVERLAALYPAEEARSIAVRLLTARLNVPPYKIAAEPATLIPAEVLGAAGPATVISPDTLGAAADCGSGVLLRSDEKVLASQAPLAVASGSVPRAEDPVADASSGAAGPATVISPDTLGAAAGCGSGVLLRSDEKVLATQAPLTVASAASVSSTEQAGASGLLGDLERLAEGCPLQYVLGFTEFCGLRIRVAPGCLIPRPETEEMVSLIVDHFGEPLTPEVLPTSQLEGRGDHFGPFLHPTSQETGRGTHAALVDEDSGLHDPANILDLCTGSGCIAYALADAFPDAQVFACDLSEAALAIACKQRVKLPGARPVFFQADVLGDPPAGLPKFDLIVSNPPYVMESERAEMRSNVLDYEPAEALFVPDGDPLRFYAAIRRWADALLAPGGEIWLEINEKLGALTAAIFADFAPGCGSGAPASSSGKIAPGGRKEPDGESALRNASLRLNIPTPLAAAPASVELLRDLSGKDRFLRIRL